jgi:argininosuccinate lyase
VLAVHLSRIGEELVLWSSPEFGFVRCRRLLDELSMMPQKKNPTWRSSCAACARAMGALVSLLALEKSLSFGYGRDLQEDKRPSWTPSIACCPASTRSRVPSRRAFRCGADAAALERGHLCATDLADFLALAGVPFREAHHVVGGSCARRRRKGWSSTRFRKHVRRGPSRPRLEGARRGARSGPRGRAAEPRRRSSAQCRHGRDR